MSWSLMAFPLIESHADYEVNVEDLRERGIDVPAPTHRAPTAAQLREAMIAQVGYSLRCPSFRLLLFNGL
jgi:hypothetical protein